ncbi:DUF5995 family protein [Flexithrix dorotheae]|uniref:DUF5995 family protein n=1 Tax=Flexithrix dorotheae TaxID=70993 RepID=UPI00036F5E15|nr:DUF5995 family protein [Flexithrix dorotheae]
MTNSTPKILCGVKPATTIDGVIEELDKIIQWSIAHQSRFGYFAALYKKVTIKVKDGIADGIFENGERMEQLDIIFANRYLDAYSCFENKTKLSGSWNIAFESASLARPIVLQHLLAGMNAHIDLDLGIAAAQVAPGKQICELENDFKKINEILSDLVDLVQKELSGIWPLLKVLDWLAGQWDEKLSDIGMLFARNKAWEFALALAKDEKKLNELINDRDGMTAEFGRKIFSPGILLSSILLFVKVGEIGSIGSQVKWLDGELE